MWRQPKAVWAVAFAKALRGLATAAPSVWSSGCRIGTDPTT
jgi:hypothetical protein